MIYLISTDGYEPMLHYYAVDESDIIDIVAKYRKDYFYEDIRHVKIDFDKKIVKFEYKADWDEDWEEDIYHIHPIPRKIVGN